MDLDFSDLNKGVEREDLNPDAFTKLNHVNKNKYRNGVHLHFWLPVPPRMICVVPTWILHSERPISIAQERQLYFEDPNTNHSTAQPHQDIKNGKFVAQMLSRDAFITLESAKCFVG